MKYALVVLLLAALITLAGCAKYYEVKDPGTGKLYFTNDLNYNKSGSVQFHDIKSNVGVTLQSSEVRKISEEEFTVRRYSDK
jgi:hypothetical protein